MCTWKECILQLFKAVFYKCEKIELIDSIVQISYLLGHEQLQTTMVYLEITTVQKTIALEAIESNKQNNKLWKNNLKKLSDICK